MAGADDARWMWDDFPEGCWEDFRDEWGAWYPDLLTSAEEVAPVADLVPPAWVDAMAHPDPAAAVAALWAGAGHVLPGFTDWLGKGVAALAVGWADSGPALVYYVQRRRGDYDPRFVFGGVPASDPLVSAFEREHGALPVGLKHLWRVHGYFSFHAPPYAGVVASLLPDDGQFAGAPRPLSSPVRRWGEDGPPTEYLAVIDVNRTQPLCLPRVPGTPAWGEEVVYTHTENSYTVASCVDNLLTPW